MQNSTARLVLSGGGGVGFIGGILLAIGLNIITTLSLYPQAQWPENGMLFVVGSFSFLLSAIGFTFLSWQVQPLKARADRRFWERQIRVEKVNERQTDEEFVWARVLNADGKGAKRMVQLMIVFAVSVLSFLLGISVFIATLPIFH